jgi:2-polyprenyl-3-methyl-5-hydroxy-6-metoxy-1,4-benzoquinol methylase|tara:strand:- start:228 stop:959 length:732 start_codon:yes stop_codon:yes gene_type:complete
MEKNHKLPSSAKRVLRKKFVIDKIIDKNVLHVGCTGGLLDELSINQYKKEFIKENDTHYKFSKVAKEISGLDISPDKIEFYKNNNMPGKYYVSDITDKNFSHENKYDVIIFTNIIEHLDNVGQALTNLKKMLKKNGELIITTNNAYDIKAFLKMLFYYESVHDEHTAYYSYLTLKRVLKMNGFSISEFNYAENESEKIFAYIKKHSIVTYIFYIFGRFFSFIFKQFSQDMALVAKLDDNNKNE